MLHHDFEESVGYWLITTAHAYQRALNERLAPEGVTFRQAQVLGYLALEGPLSQTNLADRMQIEPPTLVGILDRMERSDWIERQGCPDDRRKKLIHPTETALPIWSKILACAKEVRSHATHGLTDRQQATLKRLLTVIQQNLSADVAAKEKVS
jgi:MarR family transcriptional regulator for hemolysin